MRGLRFRSSQIHGPVNFASLNLCSTRHSSLFLAHQPFVQRDSSVRQSVLVIVVMSSPTYVTDRLIRGGSVYWFDKPKDKSRK